MVKWGKRGVAAMSAVVALNVVGGAVVPAHPPAPPVESPSKVPGGCYSTGEVRRPDGSSSELLVCPQWVFGRWLAPPAAR